MEPTSTTTDRVFHDDGWQVENGIAEWWDGDDKPKLVLEMPPGIEVLFNEMKALIQAAYTQGEARGIAQGVAETQRRMQRVLGL